MRSTEADLSRTSDAAVPPALAELLAQRAEFRRFVRRRLGSDAEADELLQDSLVRAWARLGALRRTERVVPWFYRLLRRAVIDHQRARAARQRRAHQWFSDRLARREHVAPPTVDGAALCSCVEHQLETLPPRYAELLRRIDLHRQPPVAAAAALGTSLSTLRVALHRARTALRHALERACGACARGACLDCDCAERKPSNRSHT